MRFALLSLSACLACGGAAETDEERSGELVPFGAPISAPDTAGLHFDVLGDALPFGDSLVVAYLPRQGQLWVLGTDGRLRRTIGRPGSGPGELGPFQLIGIVGDTLWAHDPLNGRHTRWRIDGSLLETATVARRAPGWLGAGVVMGVFRDGTLLIQESLDWAAADRTGPRSRLARFDHRSGQWVTEFESLDLSQLPLNHLRAGGTGLISPAPFELPPQLAVAADGSGFAYVVPTPTGIRISVRDPEGRPRYERTVRLRGPPMSTVTRDSLRHWLQTLTGATVAIPESLPPIGRGMLAPDGAVWLRRQPLDPPPSPQRWVRVTATSLHVLLLPRGATLLRPLSDGALAVVTDTLEVPRLQRFRLRY